MSQIIDKLSTIEINQELLKKIDIDSIYNNFIKNYNKLDDLKKFRSEYEDRGWLGRWWNKDELQDKQLDSVEVQAEFSKAIGQLMVISIIQSKKLFEQQTQLNDQQQNLKTQADGIEEHSSKLQEQHADLAEQSQRLENLVKEYFELKGLTEEGAQKLIQIANEAKDTKAQMLKEFSLRANDVLDTCTDLQSYIDNTSARMHEHVRLTADQSRAHIEGIQRETQEALKSYKVSQLKFQDEIQNSLNLKIEMQQEVSAELRSNQTEFKSQLYNLRLKIEQDDIGFQKRLESIQRDFSVLSTKLNALTDVTSEIKSGLNYYTEQQKNHQDDFVISSQVISVKIKRLNYIVIFLSIAFFGVLGAVANLIIK